MKLGVGASLIDGNLIPGDLRVENGVITAAGVSSQRSGSIAVPGFIDLQVNGQAGVDFLGASTSDYEIAGAALMAAGVTAYQPTFVTSAEDALSDALRAMPIRSLPQVIGAHLEGPFLAPKRLGAHDREYRRDPDVEMLERLLAIGRVTQMTIAPELCGAEKLITRLIADGVVVSAGHTDMTAEQAHAAFDSGVSTVTHLFNAMRPFTARDPGVVGVALNRPDIYLQIIVDGHHLAAETVRLTWAAAAGRVALVSDSIAAAGTHGGSYQLGSVSVTVTNGVPTRADGVLAGSVLTMIEAVRNLHELGAPLEAAIEAATVVPARILGRSDLGVLALGGRADVVVLNDRLEIERVLCGGVEYVTA
jgi:N-acetylglucosamine-6-phosphate deacetylase